MVGTRVHGVSFPPTMKVYIKVKPTIPDRRWYPPNRHVSVMKALHVSRMPLFRDVFGDEVK